ncbi:MULTISPECIES: hypothetical protein [Anaeromyxobacter]|uniref:hypothetical protein n=2 Tax=Anaeromyxobacteraceae TaxID=1524215 RepID=UPI001F585A94|nr:MULTISPECIES: hypothetical protein [unclassified Anaeromyxobacter]
MDDSQPAVTATPRRDFLRIMALAPALAAGCAGVHAAAPGAPSQGADPSGAPPAPAPARAAPGPDVIAPLRAFPLALDAEPAFVFRAAPARPGA